MKTFLAKDYAIRSDLEKAVMSIYGLSPEKKIDVEIRGTEAEMRKLHLDSRTIFWGISCIVEDILDEKRPPPSVVERGVRSDYGVNKKDKKPE